jgi:Mg2+-importing ATPase
VAATLALPYTPLAGPLSFQSLTGKFLVLIGVILVLYISGAELAKKLFYRLASR